MQPAIRIENLGKSYRVNHAVERGGYRTLRESLTDLATAPLRRLRNPGHDGRVEEFWALKDVSFDVMPGEVVGIIGRNGAGKSTLLKILSRVTKPTKGSVTINGRVGSLLEVGTGFHPELTGRENIYMNGSILGMSRREISRNFDEIVDFAGVERFIDTPVKRYSSGMQVRLAFAVAAHLQPEILIVDEVLAVGDAEFQRKCLGKMQDVASGGRTILFVSHNMAAIENLCPRSILLANGQVTADEPTAQSISRYLDWSNSNARCSDLRLAPRSSGLTPTLVGVTFLDSRGEVVDAIPAGGFLRIRLEYEHEGQFIMPRFGIIFETMHGQRVFFLQTDIHCGHLPDLSPRGFVDCEIERLPLVPGIYHLSIGCASRKQQVDFVERSVAIEVTQADVFGTGSLPPASHGAVLVDANWTVAQSEVFESADLQ